MISPKKYIYLTALSVLLFSGCSSDKEPRSDNEEYINIFSEIAASDNKISEDNFDSGDRIGVYVVPYALADVPGVIGVDDYASNVEHLFDGTGWYRAEGGRLPWPGTSTIDVYAYYPYDDSVADPRAYRFTVRTDQGTLDGYNASDFLLGITAGLTPRASVPLIFHHKMSRINVNVVSELEGTDPADIEVDILSILPTATVDFADNTASVVTGGSTETVRPISMGTPAEDYDRSFAAIVPPQTISAGMQLLRIEVEGTNYFYRPSSPVTLSSGHTLTFNISVSEIGINVTVENINEWQEGGTIDGEVGGRAPRVLDLTEIDWSRSLVHDIYYRNSLIGQVCREYLFINNGNVNAQAIVVYPMGVNGEIDLGAGYVPQVMNRNRNSNTGQYEINPASVHGGSVAFGTANNLTSYNPGTLPPVELVEIVSSSSVTAAPAGAAPILDIRPSRLTDIDGNTYPIVKIGTQYWTAENSKVEHYRDGSDLTVYYWNNDVGNKDLYGGYYTWATVIDPKGIAPEGWRVPYGDDWTTMASYLYPSAGMKLRSLSVWNNLTYADNVTGFNGMPYGRRTAAGDYNEFANYGQWWSQTSANDNDAYRLYLESGNASMHYATVNKGYTQQLRFIKGGDL